MAVLPFQVIGGRGSSSGRIVSERLVGPLTDAGAVEVVERAMLESVMREQQLQVSGAVDARSVKELGKILEVDALVMGTVVSLKDDRVEVNARLIDAESARILYASEIKTERDWNESLFDDASWSGFTLPSLPNFDLAATASAADWGCRRSEETEDDLERGVVDLKARYWAHRLAEGLNGATLKRNPGSEIRNPEIRAEFHKRLRAAHAAGGAALTPEELGRLKEALARLERLEDSCRTGGA